MLYKQRTYYDTSGVPYGLTGVDYPDWLQDTSREYTKGLERYLNSQANYLKQDYSYINKKLLEGQDRAYNRSLGVFNTARRDIINLIRGGVGTIDKYLSGGRKDYENMRKDIWNFYNTGLRLFTDIGGISDEYKADIMDVYWGVHRNYLDRYEKEMLKHSPKNELIDYKRITEDAKSFAKTFAERFGAPKYSGFNMDTPSGRRMNIVASKLTEAANKAGINLATMASKIYNQALLDEYATTASGYKALMSAAVSLGSSLISGLVGMHNSIMGGIAQMTSSGMRSLGILGSSLLALYGNAMSNATSLYRQGIITEGQLANALIKQQTSFMHDLASLGNTAMAGLSALRNNGISQYGALGRAKMSSISQMWGAHENYLGALARSAAIEAASAKSAEASKYATDALSRYREKQLEYLNEYRKANLDLAKEKLDKLTSGLKSRGNTGPSLKEKANYIDSLSKLLTDENVPDSVRSLAKYNLIKMFDKPENTFDANKFLKALQGLNSYNTLGDLERKPTSIDSGTPYWVNPSTINAEKGALKYMPPGSGLIYNPSTGKIRILGSSGGSFVW